MKRSRIVVGNIVLVGCAGTPFSLADVSNDAGDVTSADVGLLDASPDVTATAEHPAQADALGELDRVEAAAPAFDGYALDEAGNVVDDAGRALCCTGACGQSCEPPCPVPTHHNLCSGAVSCLVVCRSIGVDL